MTPRILIADDNPTFRRALRHLLESSNHWEIIEAQDGQEAVTTALVTQPDLVLLDFAMPVKDGFAAAREISQLLPTTPILMCTMHLSGQIAFEAQKSGIKKVLSKTDSHLIVPTILQMLNPELAPSDQVLAPKPIPPPTMPVPPVVAASEPFTPPVEPGPDPLSTPPKNVA
jgi:CheY-like chemotaxis protein